MASAGESGGEEPQGAGDEGDGGELHRAQQRPVVSEVRREQQAGGEGRSHRSPRPPYRSSNAGGITSSGACRRTEVGKLHRAQPRPGIGEVGREQPASGELHRAQPCPGVGEVHGEQPAGGELHKAQTRPGIGEIRREQPAGGELHKARNRKNRKNKGGVPTTSTSASPQVGSPVIVARSLGINMMARAASLKRASLAVRSASAKRAKLVDSLERSPSPQIPSCTLAFSLPESSQRSSLLHTMSSATRMTSSCGPKRRPRKLTSDIWKEVEPIYLDGKLVEGRASIVTKSFRPRGSQGPAILVDI